MPAAFRYQFRDGSLYLDHEEISGCYRIEAWPRLSSSVRLLDGQEWFPCPPPVRILSDLRRPTSPGSVPQLELELELPTDQPSSRDDQRSEALRQFRSTFPPEVILGALPFRSLQWEILVACARSERFVDLLSSSPALAFLWISHCHARGFCRRGFEEVLAAHAAQGGETSQRQLLKHLALPGSKGALKMLRKVHVPALHPGTATLLREILHDARRMAALRHTPRLGTGLLALAKSRRLLNSCTPAMLQEVSEAQDELHQSATAECLANHLALLDELGMPLPKPFPSRDDLRQKYQSLVVGFHELDHRIRERIANTPPVPLPTPVRRPIPPPPPEPVPSTSPRPRPRSKASDPNLGTPPFPGTPHIVALLTLGELRAEGRAQDNCVASYASRVKRGTCFIYKVLWPERCTLSLAKGRDGRWRCSELKARQNRRVKDSTRRFVQEWIRDSRCDRESRPDSRVSQPSDSPDFNNM